MEENPIYYSGPDFEGERTQIGPYEEIRAIHTPLRYTPSDALVKAVNMAILLGKPLLITGHPGTGKTQLAWSLSWQLFAPKKAKRSEEELLDPFVFVAKTTSKARDLFYTYDAVRHFQDANIQVSSKEVDAKFEPARSLRTTKSRKKKSASNEFDFRPYVQAEYRNYITFSALGKAIIQGHEQKKRYVVLIDEIDKAPRDFPNDLLSEIENMAFKIEETDQVFKAEKAYTPIVVITSNSERLLPEPFLRRCVYFHISFPDATTLKQILLNRLQGVIINGKPAPLLTDTGALDKAMAFFYRIRNLSLKKVPATAEFMHWMEFLVRRGFSGEDLNADNLNDLDPVDLDLLKISVSMLIKHQEDLSKLYAEWPPLNPEPDELDR